MEPIFVIEARRGRVVSPSTVGSGQLGPAVIYFPSPG
jgi:hypothetical protein